jgi:hypothetical protein
MTIKSYQLALIAVGSFVAIVAANVIVQWRSNEAFRKQWENVPMPELLRFRKVMQAQENLQPTPVEEDNETTGEG